jgi:hypothetical protein
MIIVSHSIHLLKQFFIKLKRGVTKDVSESVHRTVHVQANSQHAVSARDRMQAHPFLN